MNSLLTHPFMVQMTQLFPFAPVLILVLTVLIVMLLITWQRLHILIATFSVVGLNLALLTLLAQIFSIWDVSQIVQTDALFVVDTYAQYHMLAILICALGCTTLTYGYFGGFDERRFSDYKEELYLLILLATIGGLLMVSAKHLASFFVSLELLSVPMYGMLSYTYMRRRSLEAGLKYLVLSATASATLLMGMALVFAQTGTLEFSAIGTEMSGFMNEPMMITGLAMMLFSIAFKLSVAPFHTWTPDVYQGAPAPVTTYLASVSKLATMAVVMRFIFSSASLSQESFKILLVIMATLSILMGNLLALKQDNLKRLLAYSSIAHMGYVLVIIVSTGAINIGATYMGIYALSTFAMFGVVTLMSSPYRNAGDASNIRHYQGLFWKRPILTAVMMIMLLSSAGIPMTGGFVTKMMAVMSAVQGQQWWLVAMIIVGSAIGLYYYLRVILTMFQRPMIRREFEVEAFWSVRFGGVVLILVTLFVIYTGIMPSVLFEWANQIKLK